MSSHILPADIEHEFIPAYLNTTPTLRQSMLEQYVEDKQLDIFQTAALCAAIQLYKYGSSPEHAVTNMEK
jgi:hypothetical protein